MIPGDPQNRAQKNHTSVETSVCESENLLKTAPKGNGIVTLKSYRYALEEEAGFAWVTRNGRQTLAYLPKTN